MQKQVRELQAKLEEHRQRTAREQDGFQARQSYLQKLVTGMLLALVLSQAGLLLFFGKQMRVVRRQLPNQRSVSQQFAQRLQQAEPALRKFAVQLTSYAAAHPEFSPVLEHYRARLPQYFTSLDPVTPAPGPSPANAP
jgi:hypothetical protein